MKKIGIHINEFRDSGVNLRRYALFVSLKYAFQNSLIYTKNHSEILRRVKGISRNALDKYIPDLIDMGLIEVYDWGYLLVSIHKLESGYKSGYTHIKSVDVKHNTTRLKYAILREFIQRQQMMISLKTDRKLMHDPNSRFTVSKIKRLQRLGKEYDEDVMNRLIISSRRMAQVWNVSIDTAARWINELVEANLIALRKVIKKLGPSCDPSAVGAKLGYCYNYQGSLYYYLGREVVRMH